MNVLRQLLQRISYFLGSILVAEKDSIRIMISTIVGAVSNIILNILLIPIMSIYGAAIATLVSNFVMVLIRLIILYKRKCININIPKQLILNFIMLVQIVINRKYGIFQICLLIVVIAINYDLIYEVYSKGKDFLWKVKRKSL